jgi:predicted nucleic acid-binding protein
MRIYLDLCSLQRPLDTKDQIRIAVEAEAILSVISLFESGDVELISSESLLFEVARNPNQTRREYVLEVLRKTREFVEVNEEIEKRAREFSTLGIKALDALHLASAEQVKADYFCTCDDKFLKKAKSIKDLKTTAVSPIELIDEIEK